MTTYINPIAVSITVGLVLGIGLLIWLWKSHNLLKTCMTWAKEKLFTRIAFFWTVNLVFMAVSVLHAGSFFGITGKGHDVPGVAQYLGFAVSFFLDLVTIVLMQAQLEARYRGEDERARQFIFFIAICCSTSTFANLAISLNDFNARADLPNAPSAIQIASPYVLASFPLFVILMSIAAEMIVNVRPMDKLNETTFEADEKKRIKLLEIRNTYLSKQAEEERRLLLIRSQQRATKAMRDGKPARSFRWPWEAPLDLPTLAGEVAKVMQAHYDEQTQKTLQGIRQQVLGVENELRASVEEMIGQLREDDFSQYESYRGALATQYDQDISMVERRLQDRITTAITNFNQQINDRIDGDIAHVNLQVNESITSLQSAFYSHVMEEKKAPSPATNEAANPKDNTANTEPDEDIKKLAIDYPIVSRWQSESVKSVSIEEIIKGTGLSAQRVRKAEKEGSFSGTRRDGYYRVDSVIRWLKGVPLPKQKERETPGEIPAINPSNNGHNTGQLDSDNLADLIA